MRASRLLRMLLLLQNRGRQTCAQLAADLEVNRRTVLRDVEALGEAGLPVVVHRGARGGVELAFNYRTRLTGLSSDESEALGLILSHPIPELSALGLEEAARRARTKLLESLPDGVRETALRATKQVQFSSRRERLHDERVLAISSALRARRKVRLRARSANPRVIHPVSLRVGPGGWSVVDGLQPAKPIPLSEWADVNVSAHTFEP